MISMKEDPKHWALKASLGATNVSSTHQFYRGDRMSFDGCQDVSLEVRDVALNIDHMIRHIMSMHRIRLGQIALGPVYKIIN